MNVDEMLMLIDENLIILTSIPIKFPINYYRFIWYNFGIGINIGASYCEDSIKKDLRKVINESQRYIKKYLKK